MHDGGFNPKVDDYIAQAAPFAQPVMTHLRELVHRACPDVEETVKWSMPFFEYRGQILANMSAFKAHCSFTIWGKEIKAVMLKDGLPVEGGSSLGRITSVKDLPRDGTLLAYLRQATVFVKDGSKTFPKRVKAAAKPEVEVPVELVAALKKNKTAARVFAEFSPGCRREYVDWIGDAKREETRERRVAQAVEWIAEGKSRNWKYQKA